jgi:hypothetical protein
VRNDVAREKLRQQIGDVGVIMYAQTVFLSVQLTLVVGPFTKAKAWNLVTSFFTTSLKTPPSKVNGGWY